jgi:heat shock protein HtpX
MVVVGMTTFAVYLAATYLVYLLVRAVWALRPSTGTLLVGLALATLLSAYVSYQVGTARLLRSTRAWELPPERAPALYRRFAAYSEEMGIVRPLLLVGDVGQPNAFAVGGGLGRGAVVVDRRLFALLTLEELSAILAHELAHIDHRDSLVQTFGFSALQTLSGVVLLVVAPVLVLSTGFARAFAWLRGRPNEWDRTLPGLVRRGVESAVSGGLFALTLGLLALSRRRELAADDRAAEVTGNPVALARALRKIERATEPTRDLRSQLYVRGEEGDTLLRLLSTHPATDERVERLRRRAEAESTARRVPVE